MIYGLGGRLVSSQITDLITITLPPSLLKKSVIHSLSLISLSLSLSQLYEYNLYIRIDMDF
jgi:hypothetical protein